jgi:rhodanese-related sulfurtransferase
MSHKEVKPMEPKRITVQEVKAKLDRGEKIIFLDARNPSAWTSENTKIPGAIRVPADKIDQHLAEIPKDGIIVTYCT